MINNNARRGHILKSDKDTHFTGAIAENAQETESIALPGLLATTAPNYVVIDGVWLMAKENIEWDIFLWQAGTFDDTDYDADAFLDYINYASTTGKQVAAANQFYYPTPSWNLQIMYKVPNDSKIHISLVPRGAGKSAGGNGLVVISLAITPVTL